MAAQLVEDSARWAQDMGLTVLNTVIPGMTTAGGVSGLGPYLDYDAGAEAAQLTSDFVEWSFALEAVSHRGTTRSRQEDFPILVQRLLGALQHPQARMGAGDPLSRALTDLWWRVEELHPSAVHSWSARVRNHIVARWWEYQCRSRLSIPPFGHYVTRRRAGVAALCVLTLPRHPGLHPGPWAVPTVRRLALAAVDVIGLDHDVALYPLSLRSGPFAANAVNCIEMREGHPWDVAVYQTVRRRDEIMVAFVKGCELLAAENDTAVRSLSLRLQDCVSGHIAWLRRTGLPRLPVRNQRAAQASDDW
ncbi:terpene synthase family protein [Lentzea xinjiangensis]|nr:hypothetical protein [Lentzea xinjiangensis]